MRFPRRLAHAIRRSAAPLSITLFALSSPVSATTVRPLDVDGLSRSADCVVRASVQEAVSHWNDGRTQILTDVTLDVRRVLAGPCSTGPYRFTVLGGRVGDLEQVIAGAPTYSAGEDVVLFLYREDSLITPVVGLFQGKLVKDVDAVTGAERWGNPGVGYLAEADLEARVRTARERRGEDDR